MGALPTLRAATDPAVAGGQYYGPNGSCELQGTPHGWWSRAHGHTTPTPSAGCGLASEDLTGVEYPV